MMRESKELKEGIPYYTLHLSRNDFDHITAGMPDIDCVFGKSPAGAYFYSGTKKPERFLENQTNEGYYASIGIENMPHIPEGVS